MRGTTRVLVALVGAGLVACGDGGERARGDAQPDAKASDAGPDAGPSLDAASDDGGGPLDAAMRDSGGLQRDAIVGNDAGPDVDASDDDAGPTDDAAFLDAALGPRAQRVPLVDHGRWLLLDAASDPFGDRPDIVECQQYSFGQEHIDDEGGFFVMTDWCSYATAEQPSLVDVRAGEEVRVRLSHFPLVGEGEAHLVVHLGDVALIDERPVIPSPSGLFEATWVAPSKLAAGAPVRFHVHNHGNNEYVLVEVSTGPLE